MSTLLDRWADGLVAFAISDQTITTTDLAAVGGAHILARTADLARWFRL